MGHHIWLIIFKSFVKSFVTLRTDLWNNPQVSFNGNIYLPFTNRKYKADQHQKQAQLLSHILNEEKQMRKRQKMYPHLYEDPKWEKSLRVKPHKRKSPTILREMAYPEDDYRDDMVDDAGEGETEGGREGAIVSFKPFKVWCKTILLEKSRYMKEIGNRRDGTKKLTLTWNIFLISRGVVVEWIRRRTVDRKVRGSSPAAALMSWHWSTIATLSPGDVNGYLARINSL